jgi:hypothetical protein
VAFQPSDNHVVAGYVKRITGTLSDLEAHLNALDAKVGDGDTGSTLPLARAILPTCCNASSCRWAISRPCLP